jgi:predicted RNA binding protein YcfA (HicA-like mRNA interferase family)
MGDFVKVAAHFGYALDHVSGSHHVFRNWTGKKFVVPVHNKKVKAIYVRMFIKDQS